MILEGDEHTEKFGDVCDVVERAMLGMPLVPCTMDGWEAAKGENDPLRHTSSEARAATMRIFEVLGIESLPNPAVEARLNDPDWLSRAADYLEGDRL